MNKQHVKNLTTAALMAGLVFAVTLVTGSLAAIGGGAYIHVGDAMVYIAALVLPTPFAVLAAAVGAGLADLMLGSAIYIIPTVIVKSLVVIVAKGLMKFSEKPALQDLLICASGVVTVIGYYIAEVVILLVTGSEFKAAVFTGAANSIIFNIVQMLASAAVYMFIAGAVRKYNNKKQQPVQAEDKM